MLIWGTVDKILFCLHNWVSHFWNFVSNVLLRLSGIEKNQSIKNFLKRNRITGCLREELTLLLHSYVTRVLTLLLNTLYCRVVFFDSLHRYINQDFTLKIPNCNKFLGLCIVKILKTALFLNCENYVHIKKLWFV